MNSNPESKWPSGPGNVAPVESRCKDFPPTHKSTWSVGGNKKKITKWAHHGSPIADAAQLAVDQATALVYGPISVPGRRSLLVVDALRPTRLCPAGGPLCLLHVGCSRELWPAQPSLGWAGHVVQDWDGRGRGYVVVECRTVCWGQWRRGFFQEGSVSTGKWVNLVQNRLKGHYNLLSLFFLKEKHHEVWLHER